MLTILPLPCPCHDARRRLRDQKGAREIDGDRAVPFRELDVEERRVAADAGIVDEDVEPPVAGDDRLDHRRHRRLVGDVDAERQSLGVPERRQGVARAALVDVGDHRNRALGGQGLGDREADAARPARHQRDLALQSHRSSAGFLVSHPRHAARPSRTAQKKSSPPTWPPLRAICSPSRAGSSAWARHSGEPGATGAIAVKASMPSIAAA